MLPHPPGNDKGRNILQVGLQCVLPDKQARQIKSKSNHARSSTAPGRSCSSQDHSSSCDSTFLQHSLIQQQPLPASDCLHVVTLCHTNWLQVYDRDLDTWTDVPTNVNSVCGGWARLANGQVGLFAGHYATLDVYQVCARAGQPARCIGRAVGGQENSSSSSSSSRPASTSSRQPGTPSRLVCLLLLPHTHTHTRPALTNFTDRLMA
jgi:hypothetical protein